MRRSRGTGQRRAGRDAAEDALSEAWDALTVGRRRGLAYRVASAKRPETRAKRVDEIVSALREGRDPMAHR